MTERGSDVAPHALGSLRRLAGGLRASTTPRVLAVAMVASVLLFTTGVGPRPTGAAWGTTYDLDLPAKVTAALARHGLPPRAFTLELVEDTLMNNPDRARAVLRELRCPPGPPLAGPPAGGRRVTGPRRATTVADVDVLTRNNVTLAGRPDAPPLVFAHGFGCDQAMWRHVAPAFGDTHRLVLFDHVGAGGSDLSAYSPQRHGGLDGYAADVLEILDALDLPPAVFVGHSVSAIIGVLAAVERPERFDRLVLVCPSPRYIDDEGYRGGFSAEEIDELLETMDGNYLGWSQHIAPVIMGVPDRPELGQELASSFCRTDPTIARRFARTTFLSDNRSDLDRLHTPSLVLQCRDDVIAPREVGDYVHAHLSDSELVTLDATGHCPNLSAPEQVVAAMRRYLSAR